MSSLKLSNDLIHTFFDVMHYEGEQYDEFTNKREFIFSNQNLHFNFVYTDYSFDIDFNNPMLIFSFFEKISSKLCLEWENDLSILRNHFDSEPFSLLMFNQLFFKNILEKTVEISGFLSEDVLPSIQLQQNHPRQFSRFTISDNEMCNFYISFSSKGEELELIIDTIKKDSLWTISKIRDSSTNYENVFVFYELFEKKWNDFYSKNNFYLLSFIPKDIVHNLKTNIVKKLLFEQIQKDNFYQVNKLFNPNLISKN